MMGRFVCLGCCKTDVYTLKLMPCLHLYCFSCLEKLINENSIAMPKSTEIRCSIFPCSGCGYVIRVTNNDTSFLKSVDFEDTSVIDSIVEENCEMSSEYDSTEGPQHETSCCEGVPLDELELFCGTCQIYVCAKCLLQEKHKDHNTSSSETQTENKRLDIQRLCIKIKQNKDMLYDRLNIDDEMCDSLLSSKRNVEATIQSRACELIEKINFYKNGLLSQMESAYLIFHKELALSKNKLQKDISSLDECLRFCVEMLQNRQKQNFANISEELSTHMNRILGQRSSASQVIYQFKLEEVDKHKEDLLIDKIFGTMIIGSIARTSPHLANRYHTDMSWPCCLATNAKDFMMAGKLETFGGTGRLLFSDRDMKSIRYIDLPENCLPQDVLHLNDDTLLLSTNDGDISKISFQGMLIEKWQRVFEGPSGQMALLGQDRFIVTTTKERLLVCNSQDGSITSELLLPIQSPVRFMTTGNRLIYCILEDSSLRVFDFKGSLVESPLNDDMINIRIKCPSSLICDPFGNILVSDFTDDSVFFFDRMGRCLGTILNKESDSIACPNRIMLDSNGNLYVAQYGGDVCIFDYLSCAKKA